MYAVVTDLHLQTAFPVVFRIVADPSTPLLAAYEAWQRIYADLSGGFGAGSPARDWGPLEKDMLGVIGLEKLLAVERATVEK